MRTCTEGKTDRILDRRPNIESGTPIVIERKGAEVKISRVDPPTKLDRLVERPDFLKVDPEELVHIDWSSEWRP